MYKSLKIGQTLAISLLLTIGLTACGGGMFSRDKAVTEEQILQAQEGRTLWESGLQYVKIVNQTMSGAPKNNHPDSLSSDEVRTLLSSLYITESRFFKKTEVPLFARAELQVLGTALSSAFKQAQDNEDVNFVSIGMHKGAIAKERKTTTGRAFINDGKLNIIFGLIHDPFSDKDISTGQPIDRRIHPLKPGKRSFDSKPNTRVALDSGQANYYDPKTSDERTDWVVIDIATVLSRANTQQASDSSTVTPKLRDDIARSKQETANLRKDMSSMKEIIFEMTDEIELLKQEVEALKLQQ